MTENPLEQLGLSKVLAQYLFDKSLLIDYVQRNGRVLQSFVHPDKGGDNHLSALINGAYSSLKDNPERIFDWIAGMGNGAAPDHLELIEDLVSEVERLQKVETAYDTLREQYAALLVKQQGGSYADVKSAPHSRARAGAASDVKTPPKVDYEEPRSARAERGERARTTVPIILSDIIVYDARGKPARTYKKVTLDAEAITERSSYATKTQDQWIAYFKKMGGEMPSLPLLYAIIERLEKEKHPAAGNILKDCTENWLCTSTRFNYAENTITHGYGFGSAETLSVSLPIIKRIAAYRK